MPTRMAIAPWAANAPAAHRVDRRRLVSRPRRRNRRVGHPHADSRHSPTTPPDPRTTSPAPNSACNGLLARVRPGALLDRPWRAELKARGSSAGRQSRSHHPGRRPLLYVEVDVEIAPAAPPACCFSTIRALDRHPARRRGYRRAHSQRLRPQPPAEGRNPRHSAHRQ